MGLDPATLGALIGAGGKTIEAAFAPSPYQPRQSFAGTASDPRTTLGQIQSTLMELLGGQINKVNQGVDLPDAKVGTLPTFTGGGLPSPIGVTSAQDVGQGNLTTGLHMPGLTGDLTPAQKALGPAAPNFRANPLTPTDPTDPNAAPPPLTITPSSSASRVLPNTVGKNNSGQNNDAGLNDGGGPLLPLDDKTQGALQLLFHTAAMQQGQQQQQGAA